MILNKNHYKYEMLQKNACDFKGLAQISKQYIQENKNLMLVLLVLSEHGKIKVTM